MAHIIGEVIRLRGTFRDDLDNLTDPSTPVTVSVKLQDGTLDVDDQNATKISTGIFEYQYTTTASGRHYYQFVTNDGAIEEGIFTVRPSNVS